MNELIRRKRPQTAPFGLTREDRTSASLRVQFLPVLDGSKILPRIALRESWCLDIARGV
jgi:type II secretory ATPase GspE/PulE/Tfp pilus assembly ATPase PilB-like protein